MNIDENTLDAYLDGELGPDQRITFESAVAADARLSDDLRASSALAELISSLPRPPLETDISIRVLADIESRRTSRPLAWRLKDVARMQPARAARLLWSAAALLAILATWAFRPVVVPGPEVGRLAVQTEAATPGDEVGGLDDQSEIDPSGTSTRPPLASSPGRAELLREREQTRLRQLLDSPSLQKVFLVSDVFGGDASSRVEEILDRTPRRHAGFGRMTLSQGIIIDPEHPDRATVFAVVMDDREIEELHAKLDAQFPSRVAESRAQPELLTQLSEVTQVAFVAGNPVANVILPEGPTRAIRHVDKPAFEAKAFSIKEATEPLPIRGAGDSIASGGNGPTLEQMHSGPHPSVRAFREKAAAANKQARSVTEPIRRESVVLVWVSHAPER